MQGTRGTRGTPRKRRQRAATTTISFSQVFPTELRTALISIILMYANLFRMHENIERFIAELKDGLERGGFVKLTLGNYKGADEHLQKILVRPIKTKKGTRLYFLYRGDTRDTAKNYDIPAG